MRGPSPPHRSLGHTVVIRRHPSTFPYPLLLALLLCLAPLPCLCATLRQQHNVWYNGLFISGIAVDEASGDVFFSDAAGNRVVHQARNGSVLHVYDDSGFFSPMQLAYSAGRVYVATGAYNMVGEIDVKQRTVSFSSISLELNSVSALSVNSGTGSVVAVDGWGLQSMVWSPAKDEWSEQTDISAFGDRPVYLSSVAVQPSPYEFGSAWLIDPTSVSIYLTYSQQAHLSFQSPSVGPLALQYFTRTNSSVELCMLSQAQVDGPIQIALMDSGGTVVSNWTAPGTGGRAVPFFGWAMHVDSNGSMYVSDHGVDAVSSPYGRVVQLAANGSEVGSWSMSDGVAYAFSSVWYDDHTTMGGSCAFWAADSERGMVRVSADGGVLLPFVDAPIDPADHLRARFTAMAEDASIMWHTVDTTLVLLDTASPTTTKVWRFVPYNRTYLLLNTTAAQLGANITGVAVEKQLHWIFVSDTRTHNVIMLDWEGGVDTVWNTSNSGLVEPSGLYWHPRGETDIFVVDSAYYSQQEGAVIQFNYGWPGGILHIFNGSSTPMIRPHSVTLDTVNNQLYVADSAGVVFQFDLSTPSYKLTDLHRPVPAATNIVSMTVNAKGDLYMVDSYSRRIIVLMFDTAGWNPGNPCVPPVQRVSSSSSTASISPLLPSSSSSSSTASLATTPSSLWSVTVVLGVAVVAVVAVAVGGTCFYMKWQMRRRRSQRWRGKAAAERLIAGVEQEADGEDEDVEEDVEEQEGGVDAEDDEKAEVTAPTPKATTGVTQGGRGADRAEDASIAVYDPPTARAADSGEHHEALGRRYEYYVARYEVVAAVNDMYLSNELQNHQQQTPRSIHPQPLSVRIPHPSLQLPRVSSSSGMSPATGTTHSASTASSSPATSLSSPSPALSEDASAAYVRSTGAVSPVSATSVPSRIAELQSSWRTTPTFIDSVTDLTILGEGSSGVVYRGVYRGQACVVKLPKSAALTGAAWREWQWHLSLPPHRHLVHFLGALPMSSTSYLVTAYVQQGSLHSLLCSSHAARSTQYSRPYAVMRCMRDMVCVLCHMHSAGVVHRDVSCRNILVDSDGCMVLADLGLAIQLARRDGARGGEVAVDSLQTAVPVRWTSPEALQSSAYSSASDVWSLGVAVWEMTAGGALPYGDTQHSSTAACIRPIVAGQLALHIDERWGRGGGGGGGSRGGGGGGGKGDGGSGGDSVSGDGSAGTHTTASTQHTLSRAEQQLADRVRRLTHAALQYDVQQRPDSHTMQQAVESEWNEWQAEWASEADELHAEWAAYHAEVQRRLGSPAQHIKTRLADRIAQRRSGAGTLADEQNRTL